MNVCNFYLGNEGFDGFICKQCTSTCKHLSMRLVVCFVSPTQHWLSYGYNSHWHCRRKKLQGFTRLDSAIFSSSSAFIVFLILSTKLFPVFSVKSGRALEDLRASLFSELRTCEGANHLQQRICGPTVALSFNFLVSVGIIMMNKLVRFPLLSASFYLRWSVVREWKLHGADLFFQVLGRVGFNYPIFLTFIHYILSLGLMAILNAFSLLPASPPAKSTPFSSLLALGIVMSLSNGLANVSLKYNR